MLKDRSGWLAIVAWAVLFPAFLVILVGGWIVLPEIIDAGWPGHAPPLDALMVTSLWAILAATAAVGWIVTGVASIVLRAFADANEDRATDAGA